MQPGLSKETNCLIKDIFVSLGERELTVEQSRQKLAAKDNFEPYMAFRRIDVENKGFLEPFDFHRYLRQTISDVCQLDSDLIIKFFDSNQDGQLSYHDFLSIILPCEDKDLRATIAQRETKTAE